MLGHHEEALRSYERALEFENKNEVPPPVRGSVVPLYNVRFRSLLRGST